jgi:hypothetical protein
LLDKGPKSDTEITGRHGGTFTSFGDYSANLFEHAEMYGNPPSRSLFDMAAVAILKESLNGVSKKKFPHPDCRELAGLNNLKIQIKSSFGKILTAMLL